MNKKKGLRRIGLNEFIKVKQAANRSQDKADLEVLLEIDKNKDE